LSYSVAVLPEARRHLSRLEQKHLLAVLEFIYGALAANPYRVGRPLRLEWEGLHAARRGELRVIYAIDDEAEMVTIHRVAHRRDAYRPQ
jgi:mRNA-degrading endonuclease RelE of RelBE toxin-antitoxin system